MQPVTFLQRAKFVLLPCLPHPAVHSLQLHSEVTCALYHVSTISVNHCFLPG
jgi:hypothetical protein